MTEFDHIGACCASCSMRDYLPFHCYQCNKKYCSEHRANHGCKDAAHGPHLLPSSSVVPVSAMTLCPLCGIAVDHSIGRNLDEAINAHIEAGCPQPPKPEKLCKFSGCKLRTTSTTTFTNCPDCHELFCLTHRHGVDHHCSKLHSKSTSTKPLKKPSSSSSSSSTSSSSVSTSSALLQEKMQAGSKTAKIVLQSRFRAKAIGDSSIPMSDRFYLDVTFPSCSTRVATTHMYFKPTFTVGRLIDEISEYGRIKNNNDRDRANPLQLYDLTTGLPLNPDLPLSKTTLTSYSPVLLEYKNQVDQNRPSSSSSSSSTTTTMATSLNLQKSSTISTQA